MMRKYLHKIAKAESAVTGINRRNIELIYPNNLRKDFRIANDKALFKQSFEKQGIPVPATYAVIEHLWKIDSHLTELEHRDEMVIKPTMGSGGNGILILQKNGKGWVSPDGSTYNRERLRMHVAAILYGAYSHDKADKAMVEEKLVPHPFLKGIYENGIPDIRVIMHQDRTLMAMLRVPTRHSRGKANLHQGAIGIGIDLGTGRLGYGMIKGKQTEVHPDSGIEFRGMVLPHWEQLVRISLRTASMVPLKYLGIDIILDAQRGPLVIEINARPGLQIQNSNLRGLQDALLLANRKSL